MVNEMHVVEGYLMMRKIAYIHWITSIQVPSDTCWHVQQPSLLQLWNKF